MLSAKLQTLHDELGKYSTTGAELQPEAIQAICEVLEICRNDAHGLESKLMILQHPLNHWPDNVVPMTSNKSPTPTGGDAA